MKQATQEQSHIVTVSHAMMDMDINAFAGAGKTDTLRRIALDHRDKNILLLCFNKIIQQQAQATMPAWVKSMTFHGLAYGQIGKYYRGKLKPIQSKTIATHFKCDPHIATVAKYTLRRFCQTADNCIAGHHVPQDAVESKIESERNGFKDEVVTVARKTWLAAMDYKDKEIGIEHDFYVKQFDLEGSRIPAKYDMMMIDERQDMTGLNLSILRKQYGCKIFAGDSYQKLYGFRGSLDSLNEWDCKHRLHLTQSFRFGEEIAEIANQVLDLLDEKPKKLRGAQWKDSKIVYDIPKDCQYVILTRSNSGLLSEALNAVRHGNKIHVIGSLMESVLLIESAYYLSLGELNKVQHPSLKMIGDWNIVLEIANEDQELSMAVKRVDEYGSRIPGLCSELKRAGETSEEKADVILSTVHRFKGRQHPVVKLGDDFPDLVRWSKQHRKYIPLKNEIYCFYVAVTRAEDFLIGNSLLQSLKTLKELL